MRVAPGQFGERDQWFVGHAGADLSSTTPANIPIMPTTTAGRKRLQELRNGHFPPLQLVRETLGAHRQLVLGVVSCLGVVICGSPPNTQPSSCAVPLLVVDSQVDPNRRKVTLTIENTGTKVVTSWHVTIVVGTEPDAAHGGYGTDAFRQFEGLGPGDGYVVPRGTVTRTTDLPHTGDPAHVVVIPDSAVFADASFCGDRREAEWVFERRRAQLEAWKEIAGELEKLRQSGNVDAKTLEGVLSVMDDSIARRGPDIVRQTFRANLSLRLGDVRAGRGQALPILSEFLEEASRNIWIS